MRNPVIDIRGLLFAVLVLMTGNGFMPTLLAVRLEGAGAAAPLIGVMASAYFLGLVVGSIRMPRLVREVGHIRLFATVVTVLSASTLIYALWQNVALWTMLRLVDGMCVAGVFICIESWLNHRADATTRGSILAAYMIAVYAGQAAGQFLLKLEGGPMLPFIVSSVLVSLSAVPVLLTKISGPPIHEPVPFSIFALYRASPLGTVGVAITGLVLGAFYGLGAVFARRSGFSFTDVALFVSVVIAGGVALQWPLGRLSDRFDRRLVITFVLAGLAVVSVLLAFASGRLPVLALSGLFGGLAFSLYPLCVAHANDRLTVEEQLSASSVLILAYSAGAAAGPLLGSAVIAGLGAGGLFLFTGALGAGGLAFALWRMARAEAVPEDEQQPYQILPRTTPVASALEPASETSD
ncbi:MFS transporter [Croceicoccus mobilis]|uniref:MFS transporter n=1 Tax=Croceicoccus mobilis TaxID=1703339 RepID=UPI000B099DB1|nr:MFS transporter [Croceicoccus mobilis]